MARIVDPRGKSKRKMEPRYKLRMVFLKLGLDSRSD